MPINCSTLTVVETVSHHPLDSDPTQEIVAFDRRLISTEQPYKRSLTVGEEWVPLDLGWIEDVGMVCITNDVGRFLQTHPTEEEREWLDAKVLLVSYDQSDQKAFLVSRKETLRVSPSNASGLYIRCASGEAKYHILVVPK